MREPTVQEIIDTVKEWKLEIDSNDRLSIKFKYLEMLVNEIEQLRATIKAYKNMLKDEKKKERYY